MLRIAYQFSSKSTNDIKNYNTYDDTFDFSSAAFSGSTGHTLVFGHVQDNEFVVDTTSDFSSGFEELVLDAFDETDTRVPDLTAVSDDRWYYDNIDGRLYYDEDADQNMEDAIEIARITDASDNPLDDTQFQSSDIVYDLDTI